MKKNLKNKLQLVNISASTYVFLRVKKLFLSYLCLLVIYFSYKNIKKTVILYCSSLQLKVNITLALELKAKLNNDIGCKTMKATAFYRDT